MNVLMVAAENDAIPQGKIGGIGDVVRDVPYALADAGHDVAVIMPGYQFLSKQPGSEFVCEFSVPFANSIETVRLYQYRSSHLPNSVTQWILDTPLFAPLGPNKIYCDDGHDRPFASDANKFALFSAAVCTAVIEQHINCPDILHLHDWHAAMVAVLREYDPRYAGLKAIRVVYSIHNLSLQGVRPFANDHSSVAHWFPGLPYLRSQVADPRVQHCINPMRAGITLADKVHVVSPTYAQEILRPSDHEKGFFGGEGLENDLLFAAGQGRLIGILNGCDYEHYQSTKVSKANLIKEMKQALLTWSSKNEWLKSVHFVAMQRIEEWQKVRKKNAMVVSSIGRLTDQKVLLLRQTADNGKSVLDNLLSHLASQDGVMLILGSGEAHLEHFITQVAGRHTNLIFLNGYSDALSNSIYHYSDLFLMPSSFEPCGISQMLALRSGQPCLVHRVGGLADTVVANNNGFAFGGDDLSEQIAQLQSTFEQAIEVKLSDNKEWATLCENAKQCRFTWQDSVAEYLAKLYS